MTTTVLVDTSVRSAANVLEWTTEHKTVDWGGMRHSFDVAVMVRRKERDLDYEEQVRALPTITRLVREGHIIFATYIELDFENMNGRRPSRKKVLRQCFVNRCSCKHGRSANGLVEQGQMAANCSFAPNGPHKGPNMGKAIGLAAIKAGRRIAARFTSSSDRRRSPAKGCVFRHVC